jgi:hypothetical protein
MNRDTKLTQLTKPRRVEKFQHLDVQKREPADNHIKKIGYRKEKCHSCRRADRTLVPQSVRLEQPESAFHIISIEQEIIIEHEHSFCIKADRQNKSISDESAWTWQKGHWYHQSDAIIDSKVRQVGNWRGINLTNENVINRLRWSVS